MENEVKNVVLKMDNLEKSINNLHGKMDSFTKMLTDKYVATATFDEYKRTMAEREKNQRLEKIMWIIVTAVVTGLIAFFLRELRI